MSYKSNKNSMSYKFNKDNASRNLITSERQSQWAESWQDQTLMTEKKTEQQVLHHDWKKWWLINSSIWELAGVRSSNCNMLKLHQSLCKAESSLITQICLNCIDLAAFLNKTRISDYKLFMCQCSQAWETVTYIIVYCLRFAATRHALKDLITDQLNMQTLTDMSVST